MKKFIVFSLVIFFCPKLFSQVGINNTSPNATLDISASNVAAPTNEDGILIPRIDDFPSTNPTTNQEGMMVFVTGNGVPTKGFYYWDNVSSSWVAVSSATDADWYEENTTTPPSSNSADIFTQGNVAIGKTTANYSLDIESTGTRGVNTLLNGNTTGAISGFYTVNSNSGNGFHYGSYNQLSGAGGGRHYGSFNSLSGTGTGNQFGTRQEINNSANGDHFGSFNLLSSSGSGYQYGTRQEISNSGNGRHYGSYNLLSGSGSGIHYGSYNQLTGAGAGNQIGTSQFINNSGNGTHYGASNVLSGSGIGPQYGTKQEISNTGNNAHYGSSNVLSGIGTGTQYGTEQVISNSGNGTHYGTFNQLSGSGAGNQYGTRQYIDNSGGGDHYGSYNQLIGTGVGDKYGSYTNIPTSAGGFHYGVYADVQKPSGYAGYFIGRISLGTGTTNRYLMPATDGTSGQVMTTDGAGQLTFTTLNNGADADWYEEGTTTAPNDINEDIFTQGNVAIGKTTANYSLDIESTGSRSVNTLLNGNTTGAISGFYTVNSNSGNGLHYGSYNSLLGSGTGYQYGTYQDISNSGFGIHFGSYNSLSGTGIGPQYGTYQEISNSGNATHYGSYNILLGTGFGTQFGTQQVISNSGSGIHYGSFNLLSGTGIGIQFGTQQVISNSGSGIHYGSSNSLAGAGSGTHYGVSSYLSGTGTGDKYGFYTNILTSAGGIHYGVYSDVQKTSGYAGYFIGRTSLGTGTTNRYLMPATDGASGEVMSTDGAGNVSWQNMTNGSNEIGDVKTGMQATDHNGWIKLDGRALSTLTASQQVAATSLGLVSNLPNADNSVLIQNGNTLGSISGSNSRVLTQGNLPNVTFTGTTSSAGSHNHSFYTANNDVNNSSSQGYPIADQHNAFRTTDRRQRTENNSTIQNDGNHTHTVSISSGGSNTPLDITPQSLSVNIFIYLGN